MLHMNSCCIPQSLVFRAVLLSLTAAAGCGTTPGNAPSSPAVPPATTTNAVASGAILGYAWDQTASGLRPILGVPGAAKFGSLAYGGAAYNNASVCVAKNYALLTSAKGQGFLALLPSGAPTQIASNLSPTVQIAISPMCSAALLYAPGASSAYMILGLPTSPQVQTLDLSQAGPIVAATLSDSGLVLAVSSKTGGKLAVETIAASGSASQVTSVGQFGGMTFLPRTQNALIADAASNTVWLASNLSSGVSVEAIATATEGVAEPTAIAASADGGWVTVANHNGAAVLRLDLSGQTPPAQIACNCTISTLAPLRGNSTFLISRLTTGPVWTFDGDSPSPRIVFIPGIRPATATGAAQ